MAIERFDALSPGPSNSSSEGHIEQTKHSDQQSSVETRRVSREAILKHLQERIGTLKRLTDEYKDNSSEQVEDRDALLLSEAFLKDPRNDVSRRKIRKKYVSNAIKSLSNYHAKSNYTFLKHCTGIAVQRMASILTKNEVLLSWDHQDQRLRSYTTTWLLIAARMHRPSIPLDRCENNWVADYLVTTAWNRAAAKERNKIERRSCRAAYATTTNALTDASSNRTMSLKTAQQPR